MVRHRLGEIRLVILTLARLRGCEDLTLCSLQERKGSSIIHTKRWEVSIKRALQHTTASRSMIGMGNILLSAWAFSFYVVHIVTMIPAVGLVSEPIRSPLLQTEEPFLKFLNCSLENVSRAGRPLLLRKPAQMRLMVNETTKEFQY